MKDKFIGIILGLLLTLIASALCWYVYNATLLDLVKIQVKYHNWLGLIIILNILSDLVFKFKNKDESKRS
jgi:hypothetical protein